MYELLAQIYALYDDSKGATAADEAKREWLLQQCAKRNLPLNKNPSFIQLLVKLVFCDTDTDSRRISSYARVLTAAAQSSEVTVAADVPVFIRKYGGVEEIRASLAKGTKTPKQRADAGRSLVLNSKSLAEVTVDSTKYSAATLKGSIVLLVGVVTAKGSVEVRNVCFELSPSDSVFTAKTAVSAALSNVYTNHSRQTMRDAPSLTIVPALIGQGADVRVVDPHAFREAKELLPSVTWHDDAYTAVQGADLVVILTEWDDFRTLDLARLAGTMAEPRMADLRNVYHCDTALAAGFSYYTGIGRKSVMPPV